jgi:hypothetical protein
MPLLKTPGEVAAIAGYFFQYEIFATEIYNQLLENDLEWVEFASSGAGKLDDVLLSTSDKVIAYQVKQIGSSNFSYHDFTQSDTESILHGAFKGWQSIKAKYPDKQIDARFITTQSVSAHDSIAAYGGTPKPSFEKFIANFWLPIHQGSYDATTIPKVWQEVFKELTGFVNSTADDLIAFILDFKFVFNYKIDQFLYDTYTQAKRTAHISRIASGIAQMVAKQGNVRYDQAKFLVEFGLKDQFETRFQHAFFVDERHYQPIIATLDLLDTIIQKKNKGYIALIGNAGSGKSTLLTKWLSNSPYKVLKYYAYTNLEMGYEYGYRGEAEYFLHDLLVQIRESGLNLQDRLPEKELLDLQKHLGEELRKLSHRDEKVFIIVDGLDHIGREQQVTHSLINVLPKPEAIPDNIYFILGSRIVSQLSELNFDIQQNLTHTDSIVSINPLPKEKIRDLVDSYQFTLSGDQLDTLLQNTKGHPLFLRYTIEELKQAETARYDAIINSKDFNGDIYLEYRKFWEKHKTYDEFVHVLGLISRFRYPFFNLDLLAYFEIKGADAERVNKVAEYYFYKSEHIWQFFHNSFKEFLIEESAKNLFNGKFDPRKDAGFHLEIAEAIKGVDDLYRFNIIYHWYRAGKFQSITETVSQAYFRQQWFAFRNTAITREDIKIAAQAGLKQRDLQTVTTCFFALLELDQRAANFPFGEYHDIFLMAGWMDTACSFVFDSAKLLVPQTTALDFAQMLYNNGHPKLALELFDRATPIQLFAPSGKLSRRRYIQATYSETNEVDLVKSWANTASLFNSVATIIHCCKSLVIAAEGFEEPDDALLPEVILSLKDFFIEQQSYDKLTELEVFVKDELDEHDQFDFYFQVIFSQTVPEELKQKGLIFFDNWVYDGHNSQLLSYTLIYTFVSDDEEKRTKAFKQLETPAELKKRVSHVRSGGFSNYVFNYARLFYIISKDFSVLPETLIPPSDKPVESGFYHAFVQMGLAHAWFFHGYSTASLSFFESVDKLFTLFHHQHGDPLYDYEIASAKGSFAEQVLRVSVRISPEITKGLLSKFSEEWHSNKRYWSDQTIQEVVSWVIEHRIDSEWCKQTLSLLEGSLYDKGYMQERIADGARQARLWSKLGESGFVELTINRLMSISFGIAPEEDQQVGQMVRWIGKFQPSSVSDIQFYFDRLLAMREKVNSASHTPAEALLELALPHGNGFTVFKQLLFSRLVTLLDGMECLLRYLLGRKPEYRDVFIRLFARMLVALDDAHTTRRRFIRAFFDAQPEIQMVAELIKELKICAVAEVRTSYLLEVYDLLIKNGVDPASVGLAEKPEPKDKERSSSEQLRLKDGQYLSKAEVLKSVNSFDELMTLKSQEEQHGYFNWSDALVKVIPGAAATGLSEFLDLFNIDTDTKHIIKIARALAEHHHLTLAQNLLKRTIETSRYCQWGDDYYAKGKLLAYEVLQELSPGEDISGLAFKDFVDMLPSMGTRAKESIIGDIDNIFALFAAKVDKDMLYGEINLYRDELLINDQPVYEVAITGHQDEEALLTELLFFLITTPSQFDYISYPILIEAHEILTNVLKSLLHRFFNEGFTLKFLHLLHGLATQTDYYTELFIDELKTLVNSKRFDLMLLASDLLFYGGIEPLRTAQTIDLPLSYNLEFKPQHGIVDASKKAVEHISDEGYLKDTNDPLVYTQIVSYERKVLARLTGFSEYNIAYRIRAIGDDLQFPEWCAHISEQELRKLYDTTLDVKIPYHRPDIQKVYSGLAKVIMELTDLGYIELDDVINLVPHFDPAMYLIKSVEQPPLIKSILKSSGSAPSVDRKWAHEFDEAYVSSVLPSFDGERYILAEKTLLQGMGHGKAVEIREAFTEVQIQINKEYHNIFKSRTEAMIRDYLDIDQAGIIIYNDALSTLPKSNWLAINPVLGEEMGLNFNSDSGYFRWDDEAGDAVVESVFWQLGDTANKSGHHDSEAGFGWRVMITEEGVKQIISLLKEKPLFHYKQVNRHLEFQQKQYNTNINEEDKKYTISEFKLP